MDNKEKRSSSNGIHMDERQTDERLITETSSGIPEEIVVSKTYTLDFLDDPNFNPFATKTVLKEEFQHKVASANGPSNTDEGDKTASPIKACIDQAKISGRNIGKAKVNLQRADTFIITDGNRNALGEFNDQTKRKSISAKPWLLGKFKSQKKVGKSISVDDQLITYSQGQLSSADAVYFSSPSKVCEFANVSDYLKDLSENECETSKEASIVEYKWNINENNIPQSQHADVADKNTTVRGSPPNALEPSAGNCGGTKESPRDGDMFSILTALQGLTLASATKPKIASEIGNQTNDVEKKCPTENNLPSTLTALQNPSVESSKKLKGKTEIDEPQKVRGMSGYNGLPGFVLPTTPTAARPYTQAP